MSTYEEDIKVLIDYLYMKAKQRDWHGVSDAANDLRVLEADKLSYQACKDIVGAYRQTLIKDEPKKQKIKRVKGKKLKPYDRFTAKQAAEIRRLYASGKRQWAIANQFKTTQQTISDIVNHKSH